MRFRTLLAVGAAILPVLAATKLDNRHVFWDRSWPTRLWIAGTGVLLALGAALIGRARAREGSR